MSFLLACVFTETRKYPAITIRHMKTLMTWKMLLAFSISPTQFRLSMLYVADIIMKVSRLMISKRKHLNSLHALGTFFLTFSGRKVIFLAKDSSTIFTVKKTSMKKVSKLLLRKFEEIPKEPNQAKLFLVLSMNSLPLNLSKLTASLKPGTFYWAHSVRLFRL